MSEDGADALAARRRALSPAKRALLDRLARGAVVAAPPRTAVPASGARPPRTGPLPLSPAQQRLWLMSRMAGAADAYNVPASLPLSPALDPLLLGRSLDLLVERHESLRTSFVETAAGPMQLVAASARVPFRVEDLRPLPPHEREAAASLLGDETARRPFDLAAAPLLRAALLWLEEDRQFLLVAFHHLVVDGWSLQIFFRELDDAYAALAKGTSLGWTKPLGYTDYVDWQREWLRGGDAAAQEAYWRTRLAGLESLELPTDWPRPAVPDDRGSQRAVELPIALSAAIRALGRTERATVFMVLLAALASLLARTTGQEDFAIGVPTAGRVDSRWEPVLGLFLNTLVLRLDLGGDPTFRQTLARVRDVTVDAYAHQDLPYERVQAAAGRGRLFDVFFNLLAFEGVAPPRRGPIGGVHAPFDLSLYASEHAEGVIALSVVYPDDRFTHASAGLLLAHLEALLAAATADPELSLAALPLATVAPARPAAAAQPWPDGAGGSLAERFDAQARSHPDRVAVESGPLAWTYDELREESCRIAARMAEACPAGPGRVGLLLDHRPPAVAALLAALRLGKCYVPLDADDAPGRQALIAADADLEAIFTDDVHRDQALALAREGCPVVNLDGARRSAPGSTGESLELATIGPIDPERPAYLLYTSGTSGRPKGVVQSHRGVLGHIRAYSAALGIAAEDRLSDLAPLAVDAAVMDVFGALLNGATLCMLDLRRGGLESLAGWLAASEVSVYHSTPTVFRYLLDALPALSTAGGTPPRPRLVVLGGEESVRRDFELFRERFPRGCRLVNGFGPTESTVALQQQLDHDSVVMRSSLPLGVPVSGVEVALLGPGGAEIAGVGVGELEIRSEFVAVGYWRDPAATTAAFGSGPAGRRYRSGDLVRRRWDGTLEFAGRRDGQVKVSGRRVELGEIEACLAASPEVRESCVTAQRDAAGDLRLVGYLVPARPHADLAEVRRFLRRRLPAYMLPADLVPVLDLPRTASGKVDRRRLAQGPRAAARAHEASPPRTPTEALLLRIWEEVLGIQGVGIDDDFFELGGHSLLATQLVSRIREAFSVEMPLRRIFEAPSVGLLAAAIGHETPAEPTAPPIVPVAREHRRVRLAPTRGS